MARPHKNLDLRFLYPSKKNRRTRRKGSMRRRDSTGKKRIDQRTRDDDGSRFRCESERRAQSCENCGRTQRPASGRKDVQQTRVLRIHHAGRNGLRR